MICPCSGADRKKDDMKKPSAKQYILAAIRRQYAERVPTTVLIGPYCAKLAGHSIRELLTDAQKSAESHLAFFERFHPDSIIAYNDIYLELEVIGCELDFPEDGISRPKSILLDEKSKLARLRVPDPKKDGRPPYYMEVCERISFQIRKTTAVGLGHAGPWNIAAHLRGVEKLLTEDMMDPDFIHELMRFTTEVVRRMGDALIQAGFAPSLGEATASCSLISPQIYRDFIKPYHKELCNYFKSKKVPMALHICGYIDPIIDDILDTGIGLISLDAPSSLNKMIEKSSGKVVVMGNVPTGLFAIGDFGEMEAAVDECLEKGAAGSGFILASGCEIPLNSTEDRIDRFFKYAHAAGRHTMSNLKKQHPELFPG